MKTLLAILCLVSSTSFAVERVDCHDEKNQWTVTYQLDGTVVTDLTFTKNSEIFKQFPGSLVANATRVLGRTYFEIAFAEFSYFDFDRRKMNPEFSGEFLLQNNPIGFETPVNCVASPL
jgi:hypothetical protein